MSDPPVGVGRNESPRFVSVSSDCPVFIRLFPICVSCSRDPDLFRCIPICFRSRTNQNKSKKPLSADPFCKFLRMFPEWIFCQKALKKVLRENQKCTKVWLPFCVAFAPPFFLKGTSLFRHWRPHPLFFWPWEFLLFYRTSHMKSLFLTEGNRSRPSNLLGNMISLFEKPRKRNGANTVSESMVSNTELSEFFGAH